MAIKLKNARNLKLKVLFNNELLLKFELFQINPEGKFEFPDKNLNQSEKRIYGEILRNHRSSAVF